MLAPIERIVTIVPDDAFYYLIVARNFARTGVWTFDAGVSKTTGFHLLHAYVCALFYRLVPDASPAASVVVHSLLGTLLTGAAALLFVRALAAHVRPAALFACTAVVLSGGALSAAVMVMEWPYVVFFGALGFFAIMTGRPWLALAAGVLGALSRSDFPGLALCAAAASLVPLKKPLPRPTRVACLVFAAGAIAGLVLVLGHTFVVSGHFVQASARIKSHWSSLAGYNPLPALDAVAIATPLGYAMLRLADWGPITFLAVFGVALGFLAFRYVRERSEAPHRAFAILFATSALVGYALFYGFNSDAAQPWYSANVIAPLVVVHAFVVDALSRVWARVVAVVGLALALAGIVTARRPNWHGQRQALEVARILAREPPPGRIAAWNAGTYSFFSGRTIVNIDGLMNDDVYPYVVSDTLHCYLLKRDVAFIVDGSSSFSKKSAARGGYANGILRRATRDRVLVPMGDEALVLFEIDRSVLEQEGRCR
jgi:hypothetical protein